jgi:class 3 adenylate cyclase
VARALACLVSMRCSKCSHDNAPDAGFCESCGTRLEISCAACATANSATARFCKKCGESLSSSPPAAEANAASRKPGEIGERIASPAAPQVRVQETGAPPPEGERKTITALFADIKGSMEMMQDLDPEEARAVIDPALRLMIEAVQRYGGFVAQSTGDGIFALFGAPQAHEDHAQRALYAALRMEEELERHADRRRSG